MAEIQPTLDGLVMDGHERGGTVHSLESRALRVRDLSMWCRHTVGVIARRTGADTRDHGFLLAQTVKLGEEVGELHAEVLGLIGQQRVDKGVEYSVDSLGAELADVVICAGILAEVTGVDLSRALMGKMERVTDRSAVSEAAHHAVSTGGVSTIQPGPTMSHFREG